MSFHKIPDEDHLVRNVPFARLRKADGTEDEVIGVLPQAFELKPGHESLSASWFEFFPGETTAERRKALVDTIRASDFKPTKKSGFAVGRVGNIRETCESKGHQVRIIHDPTPDNPGHAAVKRYPRDAFELYGALAADAWGEWFLNRDIP